jgi:hypothetical protein
MDVPRDEKHYVLQYDFGSIQPGTEPYFDFLTAVVEDYLERLHGIRMALLGLPEDMRNWEQIEARQIDASFSEVTDVTIGTDPQSAVFRRTVLVAGKERTAMRVVDLVRT